MISIYRRCPESVFGFGLMLIVFLRLKLKRITFFIDVEKPEALYLVERQSDTVQLMRHYSATSYKGVRIL